MGARMAEPFEFWMFAIANLFVFAFGSVLTVLSFVAYRSRTADRSFRDATLGFGAITVGGLVDPIYQIGIRGDYHLTAREMLAMQAIEGGLIAVGLGLLFYAVSGYRRSDPPADVTVSVRSDESR